MSHNHPVILGIETSCDETAAAIVAGPELKSHVAASHIVHQAYGGVVPEYASREHEKLLAPVVQNTMSQASVSWKDIDAIAVTQGPGLAGSLLVGLSYAKGLAVALDKPLLGINHIEGHIFANFIGQDGLPTPFLCLLVSGGHTQLIHVKDIQNYRLIGQTRDDAAGEAFDKVARMLGIGYPGGPLIDRLSQAGDPRFVAFPRSRFDASYDFSFSGLKTAVLYYLQKQSNAFIKSHLEDIAASFQQAVVEVLVERAFQAAVDLGLDRLVLAGGVAANSALRRLVDERAAEAQMTVYQPDLRYCTDNAAMIAYMGYWKYRISQTSELTIPAYPNLKLSFGT
ncbi:MAG: tRNA (adenosine(37)-N6)-threonylcarbamoyltransferase complex transferase subunit TsaD [Candidatus Marinimicrobia bacterium]|nr:tRNA (adenosine(37)-N6)-threonylcarbamoyltransferase complex transferase subunit TsaD [Candidatus Neomarinimicrobiota bacterium]MCF7840314.1 tRNA (adenosine(37)-N6)-threonylcarbamoyltransferase complex transferase subunit TsaD [Candidatus Neomarinimicrobiota bacterium]MCF7902987.1 tRNA (adenosine(37)-N6)-threonylcarbamoyltransferase complex transferase subunit TsaD [Candidatus Neomarinimicrobiota bacterium]